MSNTITIEAAATDAILDALKNTYWHAVNAEAKRLVEAQDAQDDDLFRDYFSLDPAIAAKEKASACGVRKAVWDLGLAAGQVQRGRTMQEIADTYDSDLEIACREIRETVS